MTSSSLFLCHRLPYPPNKGDKIRSYALLRHLARRGPVHVACFVDDPEDWQYLDKVRELAGGDCYFEPLGRAAKAWRSLVGLVTGKPLTTACFGSGLFRLGSIKACATVPIDDVVVSAPPWRPICWGERSRRTVSCSTWWTSIPTNGGNMRRGSRGAIKWLYGREAESSRPGMRRRRCLRPHPAGLGFRGRYLQGHCACFCRQDHRTDQRRRFGAIFSRQFRKSVRVTDELPIVMTGRMDYRPNYEGAVWFAREVFPHIAKRLPNARVHFVGSGPPAALREVAGPGIDVTGAVADVRPYLQFARAVIAPLHIARGIQNKVLEAMAMAKPVVATHDATRSLGVKAGHHLWVENEPRRFANAVVEALTGTRPGNLARQRAQLCRGPSQLGRPDEGFRAVSRAAAPRRYLQ